MGAELPPVADVPPVELGALLELAAELVLVELVVVLAVVDVVCVVAEPVGGIVKAGAPLVFPVAVPPPLPQAATPSAASALSSASALRAFQVRCWFGIMTRARPRAAQCPSAGAEPSAGRTLGSR